MIVDVGYPILALAQVLAIASVGVALALVSVPLIPFVLAWEAVRAIRGRRGRTRVVEVRIVPCR